MNEMLGALRVLIEDGIILVLVAIALAVSFIGMGVLIGLMVWGFNEGRAI